MNRIVVNPVGASAQTSTLCWRGMPQALKGATSWQDMGDSDRREAREFLTRLWREPPEQIAQEFDEEMWNSAHTRRMSAELASLCLINGQLQLCPADRIILVFGSNRSEPAMMLEHLIPRLRWSPAGAPSVESWPFSGLDATNPRAFCDAGRQLGEKLVGLNEANTQLVFNLTGGFKGTVALLTHHASVRARAGEEVKLFYLYERGQGLIDLQLVHQTSYPLMEFIPRP